MAGRSLLAPHAVIPVTQRYLFRGTYMADALQRNHPRPYAPGWMQPLLRLTFSLFFRSPEKACDPVLYFATESLTSESERIRYLFLMEPRNMDSKATDPDNGSKLWSVSESLIRDLGYTL